MVVQAPMHVPVLLSRCLALLEPAVQASTAPVMVDATLGLAGHAEAFLDAFPTLTLIGLDQDPEALRIARARLEWFGSQIGRAHV